MFVKMEKEQRMWEHGIGYRDFVNGGVEMVAVMWKKERKKDWLVKSLSLVEVVVQVERRLFARSRVWRHLQKNKGLEWSSGSGTHEFLSWFCLLTFLHAFISLSLYMLSLHGYFTCLLCMVTLHGYFRWLLWSVKLGSSLVARCFRCWSRSSHHIEQMGKWENEQMG